MNLAISKCVTAVKVSNFSCHYHRNRSTLDIGVLGYIGIVQHKKHPPEVWSVPPVTPCIYVASCCFYKGICRLGRRLKEGFHLPTSFVTSVTWQCAPGKSEVWLSSVILTAIIIRLSNYKSVRSR